MRLREGGGRVITGGGRRRGGLGVKRE